jgi:hypothetical protein
VKYWYLPFRVQAAGLFYRPGPFIVNTLVSECRCGVGAPTPETSKFLEGSGYGFSDVRCKNETSMCYMVNHSM